MKRNLRLIAIVVALALLLSGCRSLLERFSRPQPVAFEDMEYTRPDIREVGTLANRCTELSKGDDLDKFMEAFYEFYDLYLQFYTAYTLSYIHYCIDMTDLYWEEEYNYCADRTAEMTGAYEKLLYALADSPLREELEAEEYFGEGFFDDYEGESLWTEEYTALMEEESKLQSEYYALSAELDPYEYSQADYKALAELYVEMIALRQKIAAEAGYDSYPEYAYENDYDRDFSPEQAQKFTEEIRQKLAPLYLNMDLEPYWDAAYGDSSESQTFDYVKNTAASMGGTVLEAFESMEELGLYHISAGENKLDASFEMFIAGYYEPFVFVNPTGTNYDKLSFAHEFGHFCNDYASLGTQAGIDVAEIFSQGMEYLSLSYAEGGEELSYVKMVDSLCVFVEQSAYASFEHQVYELTGEELTVENVEAVFEQVCEAFGFGSYEMDYRDYILIQHFFTNPMYVISYTVSNDVAMQLYQMEQEKTGSGLSCYVDGLDTEEAGLLAFLDEAGLESPFDAGRVDSLKKTFQKVLG